MSRRKRDSEVKAAAGRRYWRAEDAALVVAAWRRSGESLAAFSQAHGLCPGRLRRWEARLQEPGTLPTFYPVRVVEGGREGGDSGEGSRLELVLRGGRRVVVSRGFDRELLEEVVRVVEGWSC